jgi:hypothetical protein
LSELSTDGSQLLELRQGAADCSIGAYERVLTERLRAAVFPFDRFGSLRELLVSNLAKVTSSSIALCAAFGSAAAIAR